MIMTGIVFDTYLLNQEKWAKVLQLGEVKQEASDLEINVVYKVMDPPEAEKLATEMMTSDLVGVVMEGTTIGKVRFEHSKKKDDLQEGDLLELKTGDRRLYYQVVAGITKVEGLEARNETGLIEGDAVQLGEWDGEALCFRKFGWVPRINTALFVASTEQAVVAPISESLWRIGNIPRTSLPCVIDLDDAIRHHLALIGVTGCGKSFAARAAVERILGRKKVVCVDFTAEWGRQFGDQRSEPVTRMNLEEFMESDRCKVGILELTDLSNTADGILETQQFIDQLFKYAKKRYDANDQAEIVLVLEEAHTIVPEANFFGFNDFNLKALVNQIAQVALQGRKYGVGLIVVTQRTANVSKTVLTQCNTVICFQAFDETSFGFLANYVGDDMVRALPNLKQYNAVVAGKGLRSAMPVIVDMSARPEVQANQE